VLTKKSARGLNGTRVAELINQLVPQQKPFQTALRFIKAWAKSRGLVSTVQGYFGGIAWALLVARVAQLYPNFNGALLVSRFFKVYSQWSWGWSKPVLLCPITAPKEQKLNHLKVWDPRSHAHDKAHLMPIVTPAFPAMNSTHNVRQSNKETLMAEFKRGHNLVQKIFANQIGWDELFRRPAFFRQHEHYIRLVIMAKGGGTDPGSRNSSTNEIYQPWEGFFQSKLRRLVQLLEDTLVPCPHVRPWADLFDCEPSSIDGNALSSQGGEGENLFHFPHCKQMFVGLNFRQGSFTVGQSVDCRPVLEKFVEFLLHLWKSEGRDVDSVQLLIAHCTREEIPPRVLESNPELAAKGLTEQEETAKLQSLETTDSAATAGAGEERPAEDNRPLKKAKVQIAVKVDEGE